MTSNGDADAISGSTTAEVGVSGGKGRGLESGDGDGSGGTFNDSGVKLALSMAKGLHNTEVSLEEGNAALKGGGDIGDVVVEGSGDGCVVGDAFKVGDEVEEDDEDVDEDEGDE